MATSEQKAFCVLQFAKTASVVTVQRAFRIKFDCDIPMIITFVDGIISLKIPAAFVKGRARDDQELVKRLLRE